MRRGTLSLLVCFFALSSCAPPAQWWGEDAPPETPLVLSDEGKKEELPNPILILEGSEAQSAKLFQQLRDEILKVFDSVEGARSGQISRRELEILKNRGVFTVDATAWVKVQTVLDLFGFEKAIVRDQLVQLLDVFKTYRSWIRRSYLNWKESKPFDFAKDPPQAFRFLRKLLQVIQWKGQDLRWFQERIIQLTDASWGERIQAGGVLLGLDRSVHFQQTLLSYIEFCLEYYGFGYSVYERLSSEAAVEYSELEKAMSLVDQILRTLNWELKTSELVDSLVGLLQWDDPDFLRSTLPGARVIRNALSVLCPDMGDTSLWNSTDIARCGVSWIQSLSGAREYVEYLINPLERVPRSLDALRGALLEGQAVLQEHLKRLPGEVGIRPLLWIGFAESLKAHPPDNFLQALQIVKVIDPHSSATLIRSGLFQKAVRLWAVYQRSLFGNHSFFFQAMRSPYPASRCFNLGLDQEEKDWRKCELWVTERMREASPSLRLAMKVQTVNFGWDAVPFTGKRFQEILFFHALSGLVIETFDQDQDGLISTRPHGDTSQEPDEVQELLTVSLQAVDTIERFIDHVRIKLRGEEIVESDPLIGFGKLDFKALARLITVAGSDVLVQRTPKERDRLKELADNLLRVNPGSSVFLDQIALTAILSFITTLGDYSKAYIRSMVELHGPYVNGHWPAHPQYPQPIALKRGEEHEVHRETLLKMLPQLFEIYFPRTFESCSSWPAGGWQRTCGVAFDEVLPDPKPGSDRIAEEDLKLLTLVAAGLEKTLDACSKDGLPRLRAEVLDGNDELDCAYTIISNIAKRLLDTGLLDDVDTGDRFLGNLFNILDTFLFLRMPGKVAMVRGTTQVFYLNWLMPWHAEATLGSLYALMSDILDPDRARALE